MTKDEYRFWTGEDAPQYTPTEWAKLEAVASLRLASFLCLDELPKDSKGKLYDDLAQVLANFICAIIAHEGTAQSIESKHVRNFTINFKSGIAADAFAQIAKQYGDIIERYSNCELAFKVEHDANYGCERGCACGRD